MSIGRSLVRIEAIRRIHGSSLLPLRNSGISSGPDGCHTQVLWVGRHIIAWQIASWEVGKPDTLPSFRVRKKCTTWMSISQILCFCVSVLFSQGTAMESLPCDYSLRKRSYDYTKPKLLRLIPFPFLASPDNRWWVRCWSAICRISVGVEGVQNGKDARLIVSRPWHAVADDR